MIFTLLISSPIVSFLLSEKCPLSTGKRIPQGRTCICFSKYSHFTSHHVLQFHLFSCKDIISFFWLSKTPLCIYFFLTKNLLKGTYVNSVTWLFKIAFTLFLVGGVHGCICALSCVGCRCTWVLSQMSGIILKSSSIFIEVGSLNQSRPQRYGYCP